MPLESIVIIHRMNKQKNPELEQQESKWDFSKKQTVEVLIRVEAGEGAGWKAGWEWGLLGAVGIRVCEESEGDEIDSGLFGCATVNY